MRADPKVDYAFKRVYGSQRNADILVHLLNAILRPEIPIRAVEILNPFSEKDLADDKLNILDVRARDDSGRLFDVEIQLLLPTHFKGRILHYWAGMFHEQLRDGESYAKLRPAISICIVNQALFPAADDYHLVFELVDVAHGERFTDLMQVHVLQLPKFVHAADELENDLDAWLYFFRNPELIDVDHLPSRLNQPIFRRAIKELEMLTKDEQERIRYESRMRAIRTQQTLMEEAEERGIEKGREEGIEEGIEKGIEKGVEKGEYIGRIHLAERLLQRPQTPSDDLVQLTLDDLRQRADELEAELTRERRTQGN
jgi:predicted transposase/invertase (TIGR01784 family)